jgi:hypothetical protein
MFVYSKSMLLNSVSIKSQSKFDTTKSYQYPGDGESSPFDLRKIDSIVVLFSDKKAIKYYCNGELFISGTINGPNCKWDKSPMDFIYDKTNNFKSTTYRSLVYDESDYQKAKPL